MSPIVTLAPKEVCYETSLGRGVVQVVRVFFNTSTPRVIVYALSGGEREPLGISFEDLSFLVEDAKNRLSSKVL